MEHAFSTHSPHDSLMLMCHVLLKVFYTFSKNGKKWGNRSITTDCYRLSTLLRVGTEENGTKNGNFLIFPSGTGKQR